MTKFADLPEDVRAYIKSADQEGDIPPESVLAAIGVSIGKLRDEAKEARISAHIEDRWRDAEEAYAGIDDANRSQVNGGFQWTKSMSKDGPITSDETPDDSNRSTLYVRLTQRYVDAGTAKLGEILLAPGAKSFSFTATPVPKLIDSKEDKRQILLDHLPGSPPAMRAAQPGEVTAPSTTSPSVGVPPVPAPVGTAAPAGAAGPPTVPLTPADLAKENLSLVDKAAKKAEKRIYDWHVECRRTSHVRKVIFDAGRLGVGVLKAPFPRSSRQIATRKNADGVEMAIRKVIQPASKWVDAWNFFPDPTCGEDIQDGDHCFEREWMGERAVRNLKTLPGYIASQIDKVLAEGPQKVNVKEDGKSPETGDTSQLKKGKYETWYFHGTLTREEMGCICTMAGRDTAKKFNAAVPPEKQQVYAIVTMINDSVVRATINPLDSGEFPYHTMPWQRRTGSWAGVGIAEQIATPQKMLTAAVRSMLDNAGISAGGQIVIDTSLITPADGEMGMSPHKIWYLNGDSAVMDVNKAFGLFKIDNVTQEMMLVVELAMRLGEEATSIPLITQGQSGPTTPDTFGAAQLQNNNANQLLRSIGHTFDDRITEPETRQYYEWLLLDPDVPDDEKGDWTIDAHGSSALVQQALQDQFIPTLAGLVLNPAYGLDPKRWAEMLVRSKQLQPKDFKYTDEEQARIDAQPPPAAPQIEVARINAAAKDKQLAADQVADAKAAEIEIALGAKKIGVEEHRIINETTLGLHDLDIRRELAMLDYANRHQISLDTVKSQLAQTAMKLQVQKELSERDRGHEREMAHTNAALEPPTEPAGRAANGRAFEQ